TSHCSQDDLALLRGPSMVPSVLKENVRTFWFRQPRDQPVQYGIGNCGKQCPPCVDLICKGLPSKCLQFEGKKTKTKRKRKLLSSRKQEFWDAKPNNCKKEKIPEKPKLTLWESLFGPCPQRSWPDPCTCRLAYRERKKLRHHDPRLRDPRYQITAGDVLLYTEQVKRTRSGECAEPQPKPPPSFKVPKAVLFSMMSDSSESVSQIAWQNRMTLTQGPCESDPCERPRPYKRPYEELRPPENRRKQVNLKAGIAADDVPLPMNRNAYYFDALPPRKSARTYDLLKDLESQQGEKRKAEEKPASEMQTLKRSRIEQLKILITQKNPSHCKSSSLFDRQN
ncbi:uncharacterized protein LOC113465077, partial [Ceratina calcarata]|uniref:Uncharacterized protein LOC113465077 n=1 Tax=Ceratina calcarata TaxID=156304 RepID=A0AAJ7SAM6_9HYME